VGPAADNTKTHPFGGGGGAEWGQQLTTPKHLSFGGQEGNCEGGLCDRCPTRAPSIGNLLGFSYG